MIRRIGFPFPTGAWHGPSVGIILDLAQCHPLTYQVTLYALGAVWAIQVGVVYVMRGWGIPVDRSCFGHLRYSKIIDFLQVWG